MGKILSIRQAIKDMMFPKKSNGDYIKAINMMKQKGYYKENIHGPKKISEYGKKFHDVHFIFKYRILVPILSIGERLFSRIKIEKIPKKDHNYMVLAFDRAFEDSLRDWHKFYIMNGSLNNLTKAQITKKLNKSGAVNILRSIKEWYITILLMDQAYKEFHNMFCFNLAKEVNKEAREDGRINHLIYNSHDVNEVNYFSMFKYVKTEIKLGMHDKNEKTTTTNKDKTNR